jgi:probable rRNA maturation factor
MIKINVITRDKSWKKYLLKPNLYLNKKAKILEKKISIFKKKNFSLSILLSGNKEIKDLNKAFRKKDKITDILSFPFHSKNNLAKLMKKNSKNIYLGDIIINLNKIKKKNDKVKFQDQLNTLWIHGLVHLFGHKHKKDKDFYIMNKVEKRYLEYIS